MLPQPALASTMKGDVMFTARIVADARVHDPFVFDSSHSSLEQATLDSARQAIYVPRLQDGDTVESRMSNTVTFEINHDRLSPVRIEAQRTCLQRQST